METIEQFDFSIRGNPARLKLVKTENAFIPKFEHEKNGILEAYAIQNLKVDFLFKRLPITATKNIYLIGDIPENGDVSDPAVHIMPISTENNILFNAESMLPASLGNQRSFDLLAGFDLTSISLTFIQYFSRLMLNGLINHLYGSRCFSYLDNLSFYQPLLLSVDVEPPTQNEDESLNADGKFTVNVTESNGTVFYKLNDGNYLENPVFENLAEGEYTISVKDLTSEIVIPATFQRQKITPPLF
ncbi:hypothetical protein [Flexithrix dorotheae]|uniref:hypothetical protein n=1 Tax=Flexithrix dorotheae TaxID=70993 RepID=UPI0003813176|nr:hypothetical protein [Flexithrix dorotheae]